MQHENTFYKPIANVLLKKYQNVHENRWMETADEMERALYRPQQVLVADEESHDVGRPLGLTLLWTVHR